MWWLYHPGPRRYRKKTRDGTQPSACRTWYWLSRQQRKTQVMVPCLGSVCSRGRTMAFYLPGPATCCTECWVTHFTSCMEGFGTAPLLGVHFLSEEMPTISLKWPSFTGPCAWAGGSQEIHNLWISANQNLKSGITCQTSCQSQRQLLSPKANNQASLCHLSSLRVCLNSAPAPCQLPEALQEFYPLKMVTHVSSWKKSSL